MSKTMYKVQVGAFRELKNAERMAEKIRAQKIPAALVTVGDLMKVQCGAFTVKVNAEKRLEAVKKAGWPNAILVTVTTSDDKEKATENKATPAGAWVKVRGELDNIMFSADPHKVVIAILKKHGHTLKESSAWCSETVVAAFLEAGLCDLIGGYAADAPTLKKHAKALGIWHSGADGIKAGDIVLYGSGDPNHTEIAIDGTYNISGNYNGTVKKRKRAGRTINGRIRPKYPK